MVAKRKKLTYDSLLHLIYPCSRGRRHTSSSNGHTRRSRTGTRSPDSGVSGAPSSGCSAPWTRLTCPCSRGRRHSSTGRGCTPSRCSGIHAAHRWEPNISPHRWRPRSRRLRHTQRSVPHISRYDTGSLWRGRPCHLQEEKYIKL